MEDPKKVSYLDLFGKTELKVPKFQRAFVWKQGEEISEFWNDFLESFSDNQNNSEDKASSLYLGTLIFVKRNGHKEIIDGQQRLTTLTIFTIAKKPILISI